MLKKINLETAFATIEKPWTPVVAGDINDTQLKLAKFQDSFVWHSHAAEDELFLVTKGRLRTELRNRDSIILEPGECVVVPAGLEHRPGAEQPNEVILLEPASTLNTGGTKSDLTIENPERLA